MTERAPIMGDATYSHAHYWNERAPRCGLGCTNEHTGQHLGECSWPKEPGLPWCGRHLGELVAKMRAAGYQLEHVRAVLPQMGFDAIAIETFVALYERTLKKAALEAARGVSWVSWQEAAAELAPEPAQPARKPRGL